MLKRGRQKREQAERREAAKQRDRSYDPFRPGLKQSKAETPLVMVHGLYGSTLVDKRGSATKKRYLTVSQVLGVATHSIQLPYEWSDDLDEQGKDGLEAGNPVYSVAGTEVYKPFIEWAERLGRPFHTFAYDWRRSGHEAAEQLFHYVKAVHEQAGGRRVQIIGHSNGGCVTMAMLNKFKPEFVHSVLFAASPFDGGLGMLGDIHSGKAFLLSKRAMKTAVTSSFTSFYAFWPADPEHSSLYDAETGAVVRADMFEAETWRRYRLGPFRLGWSKSKQDGYFRFLQRVLRDGKRFQQLAFHLQTGIIYPPMAAVASNAHETKRGAVYDARSGEIRRPHDLVPGDGLLDFDKCAPPGACCEKFVTPNGHQSVLNDTSVVAQALDHLFETRMRTLAI